MSTGTTLVDRAPRTTTSLLSLTSDRSTRTASGSHGAGRSIVRRSQNGSGNSRPRAHGERRDPDGLVGRAHLDLDPDPPLESAVRHFEAPVVDPDAMISAHDSGPTHDLVRANRGHELRRSDAHRLGAETHQPNVARVQRRTLDVPVTQADRVETNANALPHGDLGSTGRHCRQRGGGPSLVDCGDGGDDSHPCVDLDGTSDDTAGDRGREELRRLPRRSLTGECIREDDEWVEPRSANSEWVEPVPAHVATLPVTGPSTQWLRPGRRPPRRRDCARRA